MTLSDTIQTILEKVNLNGAEMTDTAKIRKGYVLFGGHDLYSHITAIEVNRPNLTESESLSILREKDKDFPFEWSNIETMWIANVDGVDYYLEDLA